MITKKIIIPIILGTSLCSCVNPNIPPDIHYFITHITIKEDDIKEGTFAQTYTEQIDDKIAGTNSIDFVFSKTNSDELYFKAIYSFTGDQIKENIESKIIELSYISQDNFVLKKTVNGQLTTENLNYEEAHKHYYKIFDAGTNVYRVGGLFYGDLIAVNESKFYNYYSLNEEKTELTMEEKEAQYTDSFLLDQKIVIDKKGMLLQKEEYAYSKTNSDYGKLNQTGSYIYNN